MLPLALLELDTVLDLVLTGTVDFPETGRDGDISVADLLSRPSHAGLGSAIFTSGLLDLLQA